jgi:hypothetical protein
MSDAEVVTLCEGLEPGRFPELIAGKSRALREELAQGSCDRLLQNAASSRWLALGRLIGASPHLIVDAPTAEGRLAALRKACASSGWYRLGEKLGFVYTEEKSG